MTLSERDTACACSAFFKGHGLGNDYLVFEAGDDWVLDPESIIAVCDRWRGPGSDGIVLLLDRTRRPFLLRMFNPDGSEFERSGNGLRILAAYLAREGLVGGEPFEVSVGGDTVRLHVLGPPDRGLYDISAEMGQSGHGPEAVGLDPEALDADQKLDLGNRVVDTGRRNDAVADQALHIVAQNTGWNQVQNSFFAIDNQRMTGIVASLESNHSHRALGQQVDYFPLAFVAPLGANDNDIFAH